MKKANKNNILKSATTIFAESALKSLVINGIFGIIKAQYKNDYSEFAKSIYTSFPVFLARGMSREIIDYEEVDAALGKYSKLLPYITGFCSKAAMNWVSEDDQNDIIIKSVNKGINTALYEMENDVGLSGFFGSIFDGVLIEKITEISENIFNHKKFYDKISDTESAIDVILINMIVKCFYEPTVSVVKDYINNYYQENDSLSLLGDEVIYM